MKRTLFITLIALILAASALLAQRGGPRQGGPGRDPVAGLKNALGLTDAQVTAITALVQAEGPRMQAIRTEVQQNRQKLETLLNAASPVPVDVGNAAIAVHASEAKIKTEQDALISQVKQQLTGDQQQKLDTLMAADRGRGFPFMGLGGFDGPGHRGNRAPGERGPRPQ